MTDEELAEQYAIENYEHYEEGQTDYKALKQAFLVGLEAGRPKWHKVADGDYPPCENGQLVKIGDKYYGLCVLFAGFQFLDGSPCGVEK